MAAKTWWKRGYLLGLLSIVIAVGLVFTACQPAPPSPKTQTLDIIMGEGEIIGEEPLEKLGVPEHSIVGEYHRWEPDTLVVNKGDKVVLNVSNPRGGNHSLVLTAFGVDTGLLVAKTGKKTVEFTADKAGVFKFICGISYDHKKSPRDCDPDHVRMVGYLIVLDR